MQDQKLNIKELETVTGGNWWDDLCDFLGSSSSQNRPDRTTSTGSHHETWAGCTESNPNC